MKGKHFAKANWSRIRIVSFVISVALLFGCIAFSSAWLIAEDKEDAPKVNTFTGNSLEITLSSEDDQTSYKLIPGMTYQLLDDKAPQVKVTKGSVECYLFAVIYESWGNNNQGVNTYFTISGINETNWKEMVDPKEITNKAGNCRYRVFHYKKGEQDFVTADEQDQKILILNEFKIPETLTKQQVAPSAFPTADTPKITVKVYSIQTLGMKDINEAWGYVADAINNGNTKGVVLENNT